MGNWTFEFFFSYGTWKETIFNSHLQAPKKGFCVSILYREILYIWPSNKKGRNFELGTNSLEGRDSHWTCKLDAFSSNSIFLLFFTSFCTRFNVHSTQYKVSGQCSCRPQNSGFTRDLALPHRCWCRFQRSVIWLHVNLIESTNTSGKQSDILSQTKKKINWGNITLLSLLDTGMQQLTSDWDGGCRTHTHTHTHRKLWLERHQ